MQTRSTATIGIVCAMIASTAFTLNDVGIKFLSGDYALHQIVFARTIIALALTLGVMIPLEGGFQLVKTKNIKMHLLRGLSVVCANMVFFMGLAALPLSEAVASGDLPTLRRSLEGLREESGAGFEAAL